MKIKHLILSVVLATLMIPGSLLAQKTELYELTESFKEMEDITFTELNADEITVKSDESEGMQYVMENIEVVRMIQIEKDRKLSDKYFNKFYKILSKTPYIEVMTVNDGSGENISLYISKNGDENVNEAAMILKEKKDVFIIYMKGNIDLEEIGGFDKLIHMKSMKGMCLDGKKMHIKVCDDD